MLFWIVTLEVGKGATGLDNSGCFGAKLAIAGELGLVSPLPFDETEPEARLS